MRDKNYLKMLLIIAGATLCSLALGKLGIDKSNILLVFMVGVLLVAAFTRGYRFGVIASCISVLIFNYFFTVPLHTFAINNKNDAILILFFLIASLISSSMTARFQNQLQISKKNERTAKLLYNVSQRLLNVAGESNIVKQGIQCIEEYTGYGNTVELDENKQIYKNDNFCPGDEKFIERTIMGLVNKLGTLRVYTKGAALDLEQEWLVNTVAAQMGIALDREFVYNEREKIRIAMEKEYLKSNLLRSISHDLRTPLTGIVGASSYMLQRGENIEHENVLHLLKDINEQAVWLTTMVENMLNMTRIDNGNLEVKKQIEVVDDVVNEAITHVIGLDVRPFSKILPIELIAIPMDGKMIVQVLINLLDNAVKHTPDGCPIEIAVKQSEDFVEFSIADGGPGIDQLMAEHLFEPFVTNGSTGPDGKTGIGLGLAICKAIVQAHGGSISTGISHLGGALFLFTLPCKEES